MIAGMGIGVHEGLKGGRDRAASSLKSRRKKRLSGVTPMTGGIGSGMFGILGGGIGGVSKATSPAGAMARGSSPTGLPRKY